MNSKYGRDAVIDIDCGSVVFEVSVPDVLKDEKIFEKFTECNFLNWDISIKKSDVRSDGE